ncbi:hypothetical protein [Rhabdothermincola sp.]|uniref:hypothetical protein n=1 Tax=Rhabdothermincola sp. TaxID=2820405 RepID=UPI002FE0C846
MATNGLVTAAGLPSVQWFRGSGSSGVWVDDVRVTDLAAVEAPVVTYSWDAQGRVVGEDLVGS